MRLSNIVARAIELNTVMGITSQPKAVSAAKGIVDSDAEAIEDAIDIAVTKLVHDQCTRTMRRIDDGRQGSLFLLHTRYATDADARVFKDTERLTRLEFQRIVALRTKQIADDQAHLNLMLNAYRQLSPIWDEYPAKLFGEVEQIWRGRQAAA